MDKELQEHLLDAVDQTGMQAVVIEPGTPKYEAFAKAILSKTLEQEKAEKELEDRIMNTDITTPSFIIKAGKLDDWQKGLSNNTNPYGRACFVFANELAKNIEDIMVDTGRPFNELSSAEIKEAEHKADEVVGGVTGFMYGVAISCLADVWEYGEELRKRHNTQMGNPQAKGTINPAIINIG